MMTVSEALAEGFSRTHRRIGSVVLDLVWKLLWAAMTCFGFLVIVFWIESVFRRIEVNGAAAAALNTTAGLALLARELWQTYGSTLFWMSLILLALSLAAWLLLESYFRAGFLPGPAVTFRQNAARRFGLFFGSTTVKGTLLLSLSLIAFSNIFSNFFRAPRQQWVQLWDEARLPFAATVVLLAIVWFVLTVLETLIRCEATDLLASDLFTVIGLIGTLLAFEGCIAGAFVVAVGTILMNSSSEGGVVLGLLIGFGGAIILSVLHSYLLIVRFSSVGIMNHVTEL